MRKLIAQMQMSIDGFVGNVKGELSSAAGASAIDEAHRPEVLEPQRIGLADQPDPPPGGSHVDDEVGPPRVAGDGFG
jgi:hypothetical protein